MTALSAPRLIRERYTTRVRRFPVAAGATIWQGAMVALVTTGGVTYAEPAAATAGLVIVGAARETANNLGGAAGAINVGVENDACMMNNDATNPVTAALIGQSVYVVDDNTVSASSSSGARPVAGVLFEMDPVTGLPWVKFTS